MTSVMTRKLLRDLWSRKLAIGALLGIVAVGIGSFVGPASLYLDLNGARERYYRQYRLADLVVDLRRAPERLEAELRSLPGVDRVRTRVNHPVLVDLPGEPEPVGGVALSMPGRRRPVLNDLYLRAGTWFSSPDAAEVILGYQFAEARGLGPGDRLRVIMADGAVDLLVVATAMCPEFVWVMPPGGGFAPDPERHAILYLPRRYLQERADLDGSFDQLLATVSDLRHVDEVVDTLERRLDEWGVTSARPMEDEASVRMLADEISGLKVTTVFMPAIFLGVAALILHFLMGRMISQQRTVIGTLTSLGYRRGRLLRHYALFTATIGALGGVAGWLIARWMEIASVGIYRQFFAMPGIHATFRPGIYLAGLALAVGVALLGSARALIQVTGLEPAEALRPPPPETGGRILLERIPPLWSRLSFRHKLVLRAIFRNPFRSLSGVVATCFSAALILMNLSLLASVDVLVEHQFARMAHEDLSVVLREPQDPREQTSLRDLPGVRYIEHQLMVAADLVHAGRSKQVGVIGLRPGARLHTPLDSDGNRIQVPPDGLVLSEKLARILAVRVGDTLHLQPLLGDRKQVTARVARLNETYMGLSVYADTRYLSHLLGEEEVTNQALLELAPGALEADAVSALKPLAGVVGHASRLRSLTHMDVTFGDVQKTSMGIMIFFAGMIAFGAVLNTALVSLSERSTEVATYRVLGYLPGRVASLLDLESLAINGVGTLAGLYLGAQMTYLISRVYDTELFRFPAVVPASSVLQTVVVMVVFVGAAQLLVRRLVYRLDWLEALSVKE